jgi:hypothetical protein
MWDKVGISHPLFHRAYCKPFEKPMVQGSSETTDAVFSNITACADI